VTLNRILALKDLDFSLDQIKELLKIDLSSDVMEKLLKTKRLNCSSASLMSTPG
jgi:DNA-binding transcriptional MerR regulator